MNRPLTTTLRTVCGDDAPAVLVKHLQRLGPIAVSLPNGRTLRLVSRGDDFISSRIFWNGWDAWEPELSDPWWKLASRANVTLDVGAHIGVFALIAAHANPDGHVHAFEPVPAVYHRLIENANLNRLSNLYCHPTAVGDCSGTTTIYHQAGIPSSSSLSQAFMKPQTHVLATRVNVVTLDDYVEWHRIEKVDLIKMDTETTEPDILRGALTVLKRDQPTLIIEVLPGHNTMCELEELLYPLGYRGRRLVPTTHRARMLGRAVSSPFCNYLFSV